MNEQLSSQKFFVVAGNERQAKAWGFRHGVPPINWKFVNTTEDLKDAEGTVAYWGNFYQRADIGEIRDEIQIGIQKGYLKELGNDE